jgi:dienelactone hydrolase
MVRSLPAPFLRILVPGSLALTVLAGTAAAERLTVRFPSLDAARTGIAGELYRPDKAGRHAAVVMMHGCSGPYTKSGRTQKNWAAWFERLSGWGYVVLAVDAFNPRGFRSMCARSQRPLDELDDRPFDAYGALAWLARQPYVRPDRIALVGWSNGAMATLSAMDGRAPARFAAAAHRFRAAAAFYPGCTRIAGRGWRPHAPVLVLVGLADDWTWPKPCIALVESARAAGAAAEIEAYAGAYHAFDHPDLKLRTRTARNAAWRSRPERTVHIGANPAARAAAIRRLAAFLALTLAD